MVASTRFAAAALFLSLALPSLALEAPSFFPANLAKRFTGKLPTIKRTPTPTVARSLSDDLMAMLADAKVDAASASPSPSATTNSHQPSGSLNPSARRAKRDLEAVKLAIRSAPWEVLDSSLLCPGAATACPIFPRMGSYECIDTQSELESCGGCASKSEGEDCTAIKGAQGVTCEAGRCTVFTCQQGFTLESTTDGHGRCQKTKAL